MPTSPASALLAIGGTTSGDPYVMPTTLAELVLRNAGWKTELLGIDLPMSTLQSAIRQRHPRLVFLSISPVDDSE